MLHAILLVAAVLCLVSPALAHHGGGTFDNSKGLVDYSKEPQKAKK